MIRRRKLVLRADTVRVLASRDLARSVGGAPISAEPGFCPTWMGCQTELYCPTDGCASAPTACGSYVGCTYD